MSENYDPLISPFEMPIGILQTNCLMERPLVLRDRLGANLRTSLRGAFGEALVGLGCQKAAHGRTCLDRHGRGGCQSPAKCAVPWLFEPHVAEQRRDHPWPIVLKLTHGDWELGGDGELVVSAMELTVVLLGRHANHERDLVVAALAKAGQSGIIERGVDKHSGEPSVDAVGFDTSTRELWSGSLGAWVQARLDGQLWREVGVELATPLAADPPDFGSMLGNVAHDLVQWDLADSGLASSWARDGADAKRRCDEHADRARAHVKEHLCHVAAGGEFGQAHLGRRWSRSTGGTFELMGFTGWLVLSGELEQILPWLVVLELRGGGKKKSFGLGEVRLGIGA